MPDSVTRWLNQLGLGQYAEAFEENAIEWEQLRKLSNDDLKELGVNALGHRKRISESAESIGAAHSTQQQDSASFVVSKSSNITDGAQRRQLTVMFCDLVGSTALSQKLDPEDMREVNLSYQDACKEAIERYDGYVAKYMGDGVLAYFGYPQAHEDDAERAIQAGLELIGCVPRLNPNVTIGSSINLAVRVGIATGLVVVGDLIGEGASQESAVVGDTPNLAARLQDLAQPNTIVVASATHRLTTSRFIFDDRGIHSLKGIELPVEVYQVLGESGLESRFDASCNTELTPLIGREEEVTSLHRRWGQAREGEGQVVLVSGEPGIGKSRLCETLVSAVSNEPHIMLRFQCSPHHTNSALHPIVMHIEQAAVSGKSIDAADKFEHLEKFFHQSSEWLEQDTALIANLLSIPNNGRYSPLSLDQQEHKEQTRQALVRYLSGLTAQGTLIILFEDLHWSDSSTLELLDMLMERAVEIPMLMLVTFRPEFKSAWLGQAHVSLIALNRISKFECRTMLNNIVAENSLSENVVEEIMNKTDGVPLFIEEVTRTVMEAYERCESGVTQGAQFDIPTTLQDSLNARLDRLVIGKKIAQTGAAIGREFTEELLGSICDFNQSELKKALDELVDTGLLFRYGNGLVARYVFKHALLQDAAYNSLLLTNRKLIHCRIAEALTMRSPNDEALLAHHWEQAGNFDKALRCWLESAEKASKRYNRSEANAQYWRALNVLGQLPETDDTRLTHIEIIVAACSDGRHLHNDKNEDLEKTLHHFDKAIHSAVDFGDLAGAARIEMAKAFHTYDELLIQQAFEHANASGDQTVTVEITEHYSNFLGKAGRYDESRTYAKQAIEIQGQLGQSVRQAMALIVQGRCYSARAGRFDESLRYASRARRIAQTHDDNWLRSCLVLECETYMYKGLWRETVEIAEKDLPFARQIENWNSVLFASAWTAFAFMKMDMLDDARAIINAALTDSEPLSEFLFARCYIQIVHCQLQLASGKTEEALATAQHAVALADDGSYLLEQGAANRALGRVLEAHGDRAGADAAFNLSLKILHNIQSLPELAQSLLAYGQFMLHEDREEGTKLLTQALDVFKQIDAPGWIEETQAALML